jgi:hypothetical protein
MKLPKVNRNPLGENSPNLVTLLLTNRTESFSDNWFLIWKILARIHYLVEVMCVVQNQCMNFSSVLKRKPILLTFFPRKVIFRGKFRGISWKTIFWNFFRRKFQFFPTFIGGKFPRNFPRNFPWKKCTKNWLLKRSQFRVVRIKCEIKKKYFWAIAFIDRFSTHIPQTMHIKECEKFSSP